MKDAEKQHRKTPALDTLTDEQKSELVKGATMAHAQPPSDFRTEFNAHAERCLAKRGAKKDS